MAVSHSPPAPFCCVRKLRILARRRPRRMRPAAARHPLGHHVLWDGECARCRAKPAGASHRLNELLLQCGRDRVVQRVRVQDRGRGRVRDGGESAGHLDDEEHGPRRPRRGEAAARPCPLNPRHDRRSGWILPASDQRPLSRPLPPGLPAARPRAGVREPAGGRAASRLRHPAPILRKRGLGRLRRHGE